LETNTTYSTIDAYKPLLQRVSNAYRATFTEPDIVTPSYQEDIRPCPFNTPDCVKTRAEKTALFLECTELAEFRCAGANNDDYVFYRVFYGNWE
jgi:hypothetical protein